MTADDPDNDGVIRAPDGTVPQVLERLAERLGVEPSIFEETFSRSDPRGSASDTPLHQDLQEVLDRVPEVEVRAHLEGLLKSLVDYRSAD